MNNLGFFRLALATAALADLLVCMPPGHASAQTAALKSPSPRFSADSAAALSAYWAARRQAAGTTLLVGAGTAALGGVLWAASSAENSTLRNAGILATGAGVLVLPAAAWQRIRLRQSLLRAYLNGQRPVPPQLWQRALEHQRRQGF